MDWTPVSEALPDKAGIYLVTDNDGRSTWAYFDEESPALGFEKPGFYYEDDEWPAREIKAVAWMRFPPAYTGN